MASECTIRTMRRDEVDLAVEWAAAEGWNPGLHDAGCFLAADPQGFLVGELDGEPVAVISAVRYGRDFGFVGFYIVRPGARGRGYGLAIWGEAMRRLEGRNVGLDGVVEQQANYRKSGFELAHRNVRYEGRGSGSAERAPGRRAAGAVTVRWARQARRTDGPRYRGPGAAAKRGEDGARTASV